jgi:hypothetical protein
MKKATLWIAVAMISLFTVGVTLAASQNRQDGNQAGPEEAVKQLASRKADANAPPPAGFTQQPNQQQIEEMRQRARERIRKRAEERRSRMIHREDRRLDVNAATFRPKREIKGPNLPAAYDTNTLLQQQLLVLERQLTNEETKHRDRLARLSRIRELAQQQGDSETVARVDGVLEKEKQLYEMRTLRMSSRKQRIIESQEDVNSLRR